MLKKDRISLKSSKKDILKLLHDVFYDGVIYLKDAIDGDCPRWTGIRNTVLEEELNLVRIELDAGQVFEIKVTEKTGGLVEEGTEGN